MRLALVPYEVGIVAGYSEEGLVDIWGQPAAGVGFAMVAHNCDSNVLEYPRVPSARDVQLMMNWYATGATTVPANGAET